MSALVTVARDRTRRTLTAFISKKRLLRLIFKVTHRQERLLGWIRTGVMAAGAGAGAGAGARILTETTDVVTMIGSTTARTEAETPCGVETEAAARIVGNAINTEIRSGIGTETGTDEAIVEGVNDTGTTKMMITGKESYRWTSHTGY
jgi:hypothetical protein